MENKYHFQLEFADIVVKFSIPTEVNLPEAVKAFLYSGSRHPDVEYEIKLLEEPLDLSRYPAIKSEGKEVYPYKEGVIRVFLSLTEKDGCQVACYMDKRQKNILYYPAKRWEFYSKELRFLHLIGIEMLLLQKDAFLLHSSLVEKDGYAVLFSGPSGIGKSTQASLWEKYLDADVLNGDRCVIRKTEDGFYGCGSPWSGTSGIYKRRQAPIKGIFVLKQGQENRVRRLKAEAFANILQQTIVNGWDAEFMEKITDLIIELLENVPVYELSCRIDREAVQIAYKTLFKGSA